MRNNKIEAFIEREKCRERVPSNMVSHAAERLQITSTFNSVALGVIALVFSLVVALVIFPRVNSASCTSGNLTNTVEMGAFYKLGTFNPNTVSGGSTTITNVNINGGYIYISPIGVSSLTSGASFASLSTGTGLFSLTRAGYYSGTMKLIVDQTFVDDRAGQSCVLTVFSDSTRPSGFYGSIPFVSNVRVAAVANNNPSTNIASAPFSFFYNGTLPIEMPFFISCQVFGGSNVFADAVNIIFIINRENGIGGV